MEVIIHNYYEIVAIIIFGIGFTMMLLNKNLIKKIIGFNFMDTSIYLFLASKGYVFGRVSPIVNGIDNIASISFTRYINPVPAGLVLTGIVVSVSSSAFLLAIAIKLYKTFNTLDINKIIEKINEQENEK